MIWENPADVKDLTNQVALTDSVVQTSDMSDSDNATNEDATPEAATSTETKPSRKQAKEQRRQEKAEQRQVSKDAKLSQKMARQQERRDKRQQRKELWITVAGANPSATATWALLGSMVIVAVVNGALSSVGLYGYGREIQDLPMWLAPLVPVGIEGLTVVAIASIYVLRHQKWHVRLYCWFVFFTAVAMSISGNVAHSANRDKLALIGAAAPPAFLTLATHLVVVAMRRLEVATELKRSLNPVRQKNATPKTETPEDVNKPQERPSDIAKRRWIVEKTPATKRARDTEPARQKAEQLAAQGVVVSDIKRQLDEAGYDINRRNIERWTKQIRDNKEVGAI